MNIYSYLENTMVNSYRIKGLACQFVIFLLSVYAGTIYPPSWIAKKHIADYIPSVLPFAIIITIILYLIFLRESKTLYIDEIVFTEPSESEPTEKE